jgi:acetyl esterase/lipase
VNIIHNANMVHESAINNHTKGPGKRALIRNLWSLVSADGFESPAPTHKGMRYRAEANKGIQPLVDVYLPEHATGPLPSVVLVHGGGFLLGSRNMKPMRFLAGQLLGAGFAVCSVDYRLIFRGGRLTESRRDVADALEWWLAQAERWALDTEQVSMVGLSAGATLSLFTAGEPTLPTPKRVVCVFGLYNYEYMNGSMGRWLPQLLTGSKEQNAWREHSVMRAPQPQCETMLLHGDADQVVPVAQTHELAAHRKRLGLKTRTHIYPNAPHGFFNYRTDTAKSAVADILSFLTHE